MQGTETSFHSPSRHFAKPYEFQLGLKRPMGLKVQKAKSRCYPRDSKEKCFLTLATECQQGDGTMIAVKQYPPNIHNHKLTLT